MAKTMLYLLVGAAVVLGCSGSRPRNLGAADGSLSPCPSSPNCVSSQSADSAHFTEPLHYEGSPGAAEARLIKVIASFPRSRIVAETDGYLHVEFTSLIFRFVDDVEFLFAPDGRTIHVRSASRVGYSDLGVNRKRVEQIRRRFLETA
ncbi:MAG: DUF1499 domain-containing protein [Smithellaceae bacterium]|nr:DUF1499 domain-containing protein [Smithellaceae bacterium]